MTTTNPASAYLTPADVRRMLGVSKFTLIRWVQERVLPQPRRLTPRKLYWPAVEIEAVLDRAPRGDVADLL